MDSQFFATTAAFSVMISLLCIVGIINLFYTAYKNRHIHTWKQLAAYQYDDDYTTQKRILFGCEKCGTFHKEIL